MQNDLSKIINQYKNDSESVYNTWFINNEDRLKAFRSIRRGVLQVVEDIKNNTFPNDFKGSSLEFVLSCIAEQKQVFMAPQYFTSKTRFLLLFKNKMCNTAFKIHEIYSFHITQRYIVIRLYGNDTKFCMGVWRKR